jgi:peptide subunit release factor 1 (eRF1)
MPALRDLIDTLAAYEPSEHPVVSLYLNLQPDQHGRDNYDVFVRKEFKERLRSYGESSGDRRSLASDLERIQRYLEQEIRPSAHGLALFACGPRDLFEALQLDAPIDRHRLYIDTEPHLYPLARLDDQLPRYAALLLDTRAARLFVFSGGTLERHDTLESEKTRRTQQGGWAQNRFQRHVDNLRQQHVKEAVEMLERLVVTESIPHVILSGDAVVMPMVREQLSEELSKRIVDVTQLDQRAPEREVLEVTLARLRERDAQDDRDRVSRLLGDYRAGGLAVVGPEAAREALELGQVDELVVSAALDRQQPPPSAASEDGQGGTVAAIAREPVVARPGTPTSTAPGGSAVGNKPGTWRDAAGSQEGEAAAVADTTVVEQIAEDLVTKAAQTGARVTFIEDASLLDGVGGVGAFLRFKL